MVHASRYHPLLPLVENNVRNKRFVASYLNVFVLSNGIENIVVLVRQNSDKRLFLGDKKVDSSDRGLGDYDSFQREGV